MNLTELTFENYKAFPGRAEVQLRPLTLLIGRNSSGKSAVARLPVLLSRALSERAEAPVELDIEGLDFGASFVDLINNRKVHGAIGLGAGFLDLQTGAHYQFRAKVQNFSELYLQVVSSYELLENEQSILSIDWEGTDPLEIPRRYRCRGKAVAGEIQQYVHGFQGLLPFIVPMMPSPNEPVPLALKEAFSLHNVVYPMRYAIGGVGYLGPFRPPAQRAYRFPGGRPQHVGSGGVQAPAILGADVLRNQGALLKSVSDWYVEHLGGWALDIERQGEMFSLVLTSPDDPAVRVNLADAGAGLAQVLPLVVQRKFDAASGGSGGIEIVEQPELHLHPGAHGALADLYIDAARRGGMRFLIETHSENFILRLRRRIAEEKLSPKDVSLYWVDDGQRPGSRLVPIEIDAAGNVSDWPRGVFAEDFEEVKAIRAAQRGRSDT